MLIVEDNIIQKGNVLIGETRKQALQMKKCDNMCMDMVDRTIVLL